ncbi:MAG TPA: C25 family cysteine peptidase [Syntrophomonadaceae bacterium]|nr:C25 family cysteine peptidase [Syntrophomonadaceae bacterium]
MDIQVKSELSESESLIKINVELHRTAVKVRETQMGSVVQMEDWPLSGLVSGPGLPAKTLFVALPLNTQASGLHVELLEKINITQKPAIMAPRPPYSSDVRVRPVISPKPSLYRSQKKNAPPPARLLETRWMGDIPIAVIEISPFSFDRKHSLRMAAKLEIIINLESCARQRARQQEVFAAQSIRNIQLAHSLVINPEDIGTSLHHFPLPPDPVDYLIITDNLKWDASHKTPIGPGSGDLAAAFTTLSDWRRQVGLLSRLVTVSDIVTKVYGDFSTGSRDLQNIIRRFLIWAHTTWGVVYVLMGGDQSIVPIRTVQNGWWTPALPTDFYYANLSESNDWLENQTLDGQEVDLNIDLSIGRAPVASASQAEIFVNKVITYEQLRQPNGTAVSSDWLHKVLFVATSWNMSDHATDILPLGSYPPGDNHYYHDDDSLFALIKLVDQLVILPETNSDNITNNQPDENRFCHAPGKPYIKLHSQLTYKDIGSICVQTNTGSRIIARNANASSTKPGWCFDNNTLNWILVYGIPDDQAVLRFVVQLKKEFREPQNLLASLGDGDFRPIPYNHQAMTSKFGWFYVLGAAESERDLLPSNLDSIGLPLPTLWIAVYDNPGLLNPSKFIFDPTDEEGSMSDQEVLRKQLQAGIPEWDLVSRLYDDVVDLPAIDRSVPEVQYYTRSRLRDKLNQGQHIVSLSGHGLPEGCCDGFDTDMASNLINFYQHGIFYADSCLTNRYTEDSVSKRLVFNPSGGAVAYVGYMDEIAIGLGKQVQQTFFGCLTPSHLFIEDETLNNRLGIAFDAARLALQQDRSPVFHDNEKGIPYTVIMMSLLGDPALKVHRIPPPGFAAFYTNESVRLARLGGYTNARYNDSNPLTHLNWGRHQSNSAITADLKEKFRQQHDRQLSMSVDQCADFFANSVMRFINAGIRFVNSFQEPDQNSLDFYHHQAWAKNNLDYAGIRQGTVRAELLQRVSDSCSFVLQDRRWMMVLVYTFESVMLGEIGGFTGAFQADNSIDPNSYRKITDFAWAREYLIKKYEYQLNNLQSRSGSSEFLAENFYADVYLRLNAFGVFGQATSINRNYYFNYAKGARIPQLTDNLAALVRRLFIELNLPEDFSPQMETRFSDPAGSEVITNQWSATAVLGHIASGTFKIYNQGGSEVKIDSWQFTDDFTSHNTQFSISDDTIYFGHPLEAQISFQTTRPGDCTGRLILSTSNRDVGSISIDLRVYIASPQIEESPAAIDYGRARVYPAGSWGVDGSVMNWVFLYNSGDADAYCQIRSQLENENPTGQFWQTESSLITRLLPRCVHSFPVTYAPTCVGEARASLLIDYYPAGRWDLAKIVRVQLQGEGFIPAAQIELDTTDMDYGLQAVNQEYHKTITIMNKGDDQLLVTGLDIVSPGATDFIATNFYFAHGPGVRPSIHYSPVPLSITPNSSQMIDIVFYPNRSGLTYSGTLSITSNDLKKLVIIVPLAGVTAGPRCYVRQEYLNFGILGSQDAPVCKDVMIQSQGTTDLNILDILVDPPCDAFTIHNTLAPLPKIMHPGQSTTLQISFQYIKPGQYSSWLKIISDDPDHPTVKVRVVGSCK